MLELLSGKVHLFVTGVTLVDLYKNRRMSFNVVTEVVMKDLSCEEIDWYIHNEKHIFERCEYSVSGKGGVFISKINGDYYNVLGMPINTILERLEKWGYSLTDFS